MPHFMPMQDYVRGLAETAGQILLALAALRAGFLMARHTHHSR